MNIAFNEMSEAGVSNEVLKSDNASIEVKLASPNNDTATVCTYDIVWVWDSSEMYTAPDGGTLPINKDGKAYNYEFSTTINGQNETDLSALTLTNKKVVLQSGASISSSSATAVTKKYDIAANIYNLPVEQTNLFGKNFKAHVTIDSLNCNMKAIDMTPLETTAEEGTLAHYINNVYNSKNNRSNLAVGAAGLYYHDNNLPNGAEDNTYRYAGEDKKVNNYVCFQEAGMDCTNENNLYRIISVDSNTNQTKVIKATSLGNMKWNEKAGYAAKAGDVGLTVGKTYTNLWAMPNGDGTYYTSSLNDYLNGTYLTILGDKANKIETITWKVGGYTWAQHESSNAKQIYDIEMGSTPTINRQIGLMYASEYMYAALPEFWTLVGYNSSDATKDYRASKGRDWMLSTSNSWTISRRSDTAGAAFLVGSYVGRVYGGDVLDNILDSYDRSVRPSFVLSSNVKITNAEDGVGTKEKPMIII